MNVSKFEDDFSNYKDKLSKNLDEKTVMLMLHAFCMGYCQLSDELSEEFGAYIDLNPVFDKVNEMSEVVSETFK